MTCAMSCVLLQATHYDQPLCRRFVRVPCERVAGKEHKHSSINPTHLSVCIIDAHVFIHSF